MKSAAPGRLAGLMLILALVLAPPAAGRAAPPAIQGLGPHDALLVLDPAGEAVFAHNPDRPMVPASTLKVLTSLAAIHYLGPSYRFPTDFFLDEGNNLVVKGYGDPLLISEIMAAMALTLAAKLPPTIQDIILDESYFAEPLTIPGVSSSTNPYDAPNGALCANFNTVFFTHVNGRPQSAEEQTPLLPMVAERIRRSGLKNGRVVLSRRNHEALLYAGALFRHFLVQEGVAVQGRVEVAAEGPAAADRIHRHTSPYDLAQIIHRLLEFSNNFTANQLLLAMGAQRYGAPATLEKGVRAMSAYARQELGLQNGVFVEGSGISRGNRLSARAMMTILDHFRPHAHLMPREGREYYKTGTLQGVRTRAGYIEVQPGVFYRFALFRNRSGRATAPVMRQIHRHLSVSQP